MRILIHGINFYPEAAGVGKYTGEMASWLAARGHQVRVVTAPPHFPEWRVAPVYRGAGYVHERPGVSLWTGAAPGASSVMATGSLEIFRCPLWVPKQLGGLARLLYLASFAISSLPVLLLQMHWKPEVVLAVEPTFFCAPQALLAARLCRAKSWLHVQDFEVDAAFELGDWNRCRGRAFALAIERRVLARFDRVSAISAKMVARLERKGVEASRCVLFPNWVDTETIRPLAYPSPLRRELGIPEDTVVALYSGSMGQKQGLDLLVRAARKLAHFSGLQFVFCGEGPYRITLAEKSAVLPNVTLIPFQPSERLNDLLNLADIHLLPQRAGAADLVMPSKLTGMLASGRPVVATAAPNTQLEAAVRGLGMAVPPGDVEAFASAIAGLTVNRELRKAQGREARRYAESELNAPVLLAAFERSLLELCGRRHTIGSEYVTESEDGEIASRKEPTNLAGVAGVASDRKTFI